MKSFSDYIEEDAIVNTTGPAIDMNPTGLPKRDKRKKYDHDNMHRRNMGLAGIKHLLKGSKNEELVKEDKGTFKHHVIQPNATHAQMHALAHKDLDADGDVDKYDKELPDEITGTEKDSDKIQKKNKKKIKSEPKDSKVGVAFL